MNRPKFPDSCRFRQFAVRINFLNMFADCAPSTSYSAAFFMRFIRRNGHLDDAVQTVFKDAVGLLNLAQREGVGNKRRGVQQGGIDCKDK